MKYTCGIAALCAALLLSSCHTGEQHTEDTSWAIPTGTAANDMLSEDYTLCLQNEYLEFWMNPDTTAWRLLDRRGGGRWSSSENIAAVTYLTGTGLTAGMDVKTHSVARGQYQLEKRPEEVAVAYCLGDFSEDLRLPYAMTRDDYAAICQKVTDEFALSKLESAYQYTVLEEYTGEQRESLLASFPYLEKGPLVVLRNYSNATEAEKKALAQILEEAGYDAEQYERDAAFYAGKQNRQDNPGFRFSLCYRLQGDALIVSLPAGERREKSAFPLLQIDLLPGLTPGLAADSFLQDGYFLLPDGSGSLMYFHNGKSDLPPYAVQVYDADACMAEQEQTYDAWPAYLPVYGVSSGGQGILAEITDGEAVASICAYPGGGSALPYVYPSFRVRESYKSMLQTSSAGQSEYFMLTQAAPCQEDLTLRLTPLAGGEADYNGMARRLRQNLFWDREPLAPSSPAVTEEWIGQVQYTERFLGMPVEKTTVLTPFAALEAAAASWREEGGGPLNIRLSGWFGGGLDHRFPQKAAPEKALGGVKGFSSLKERLAQLSVGFYPDAELQYTGRTGFADGFSPKKDGAYLINRTLGRKWLYNPATFKRDPAYGGGAYIHGPSGTARAFSAFFQAYEALGPNGVSLRSAGAEINADFRVTGGKDRQLAAKELAANLSGVKEQGYTIMSNGANARQLKYLDYCARLPGSSNRMDITDEAIPFLQMVLSGYVRYSSQPLNQLGSVQDGVLDAALTASDLYYVLTAQNGETLRDTDYASLYSTSFQVWEKEIQKTAGAYQKKLEGLSGLPIVAYQRLAEGVRAVDFSNGRRIVVNQGDTPAVIGGVTVPAHDFVCLGG